MSDYSFDPECFKDKTIIFCLPGRQFSNNFLIAWTELYNKCKQYGIKLYYINKYTSNVYYVRNMCLGGDVLKGKHQKPYQGSLKYDYIMWIDSDIVFTTDQFFYMLYQMETKEHIKVLSGLYLMQNNLHYATVKNMDFEFFKKNGSFEFMKKTDSTVDSSDLYEVDYTGFGFMLIKHGIFEQLMYPWFSPINITIKESDIQDFCSEDVGFCLKLKKKDIPIYIASKVKVKHEKMILLG